MISWITLLIISIFLVGSFLLVWLKNERKYDSSSSVASAYDNWTNDRLLERLWGEHVHLGYYKSKSKKTDFRDAKIDFVHELVRWSGLYKLPKGSRVIDIGCGIGGSSRILSRDYGFDVLGITISPAQVRRAIELTPSGLSCKFKVMDALDLHIEKGTFDAVWSVEAGPHMPNKQLYANEMLRVLRPGGILAVADWNLKDLSNGKMTWIEKSIHNQLLNQWAHPEFASIEGFKRNLENSPYIGGKVETDDWTMQTLPSWNDSIIEGFRRPRAVLGLGPSSLLKGFREIPTILLMNWAFSKGLMRFGVFRSRG